MITAQFTAASAHLADLISAAALHLAPAMAALHDAAHILVA